MEIILSAGAIGAAIGFSIKFFADLWKRKIDSVQEVKVHKKKELFSNQLEAFKGLMSTITTLQIHVENLWDSVTEENLSKYSASLEDAKEKFRNWSLLITNDDIRNDLWDIESWLDDYNSGKSILGGLYRELKTGNTIITVDQIRKQIEKNKNYKEKTEKRFNNIINWMNEEIDSAA